MATTRLTVEISKLLKRDFKSVCATDGLPMNYVLSTLLKQYVNDRHEHYINKVFKHEK